MLCLTQTTPDHSPFASGTGAANKICTLFGSLSTTRIALNAISLFTAPVNREYVLINMHYCITRTAVVFHIFVTHYSYFYRPLRSLVLIGSDRPLSCTLDSGFAYPPNHPALDELLGQPVAKKDLAAGH